LGGEVETVEGQFEKGGKVMRLLQEHRTAVIVFVVGFMVWLLFHYATKKTAAIATAAAVNPTAPPSFSTTLSYP
jgi:hypothetical protein